MESRCSKLLIKKLNSIDIKNQWSLVVLNALTDMYAKCGDIVKARRVFDSIACKDNISWNSMLTGYIRQGLLAGAFFCSLKIAAQIHGWVLRRGIEWNTSVVNAMIVVYSNLGKLDGAKALLYFEQMVRSGTSPDSITFVAILSACAHLGLVNNGERLFWLMRKKYGIDPRMEHYACMVNLYGSAGLIDEAFNMIVERMEFEAGPTV
ncbi:hypothetical protein PVK06_039525 [Gossypium arboreum]|uniref:Pentatricopeptide repeat-containing protein n=1 Tax=Gossypium arboreum TaxID=29729 RepID=A0ABR0N350_GOSAR|nr:hypothetical protein PVK06_039525 [Gossypium arboreum]